ncbi:hypothetical protein Agub_g3456 [Astrephomene gubernaculifera]|uniref:Uncharacterized protein n=1 Tax=Astrephomene gubernaculifera TaxID=47775 RepID=A0AAD3DJX4_9CHLO|nr:hypothetical protein Agub_g3456 [Astrephomene gubernaculifera]
MAPSLEVTAWNGDIFTLRQVGGLLPRTMTPGTPRLIAAAAVEPALPAGSQQRKRRLLVEPLGVWVKDGRIACSPQGSSNSAISAVGNDASTVAMLNNPSTTGRQQPSADTYSSTAEAGQLAPTQLQEMQSPSQTSNSYGPVRAPAVPLLSAAARLKPYTLQATLNRMASFDRRLVTNTTNNLPATIEAASPFALTGAITPFVIGNSSIPASASAFLSSRPPSLPPSQQPSQPQAASQPLPLAGRASGAGVSELWHMWVSDEVAAHEGWSATTLKAGPSGPTAACCSSSSSVPLPASMSQSRHSSSSLSSGLHPDLPAAASSSPARPSSWADGGAEVWEAAFGEPATASVLLR